REGGKRALLNLGHTFGHALEAAAGYDGTLLHGEAVSIGMVMAFDLSVRMGLCESDDLDRVRNHLLDSGLPVDAKNIKTDIDYLMTVMRGDKKVTGGKMTFILANGIGDAFITQDVREDDVRSLLAEYIA
ncbi:MAG: 3-dehydroquinate synthase, partial [Alphaproteobacteria bacterium]|nr:3-dehydroquinate synthase [Alphaproteobacteria bacterium]